MNAVCPLFFFYLMGSALSFKWRKMEGKEKNAWICLSTDILIGLRLTEKEIHILKVEGQNTNYALFVIILLHPI